jgi:aldose 1-epimerase
MKQLQIALLSLGMACAASLVAAPSARTTQSAKPKMRYTAVRSGDSVVLSDATTDTVVSILPSLGNMAYEMKVKGHNVLRYQHATLDEFRKAPNGIGVPFMGPWANRLDEQAFYANGKRYPFDMALGNVRGAIPIHGFITTTDQWKVVEMKASKEDAWVTSRLEFYKVPAWMKQWPFAHTVDMTYRLKDGVLEVLTEVTNLANEPMPLAIGYHPYFQLTDSKRDEWVVSVGAKKRYTLSPQKLPTGETEPIEKVFADPAAVPVKDYDLDDVFGDLVRDAQGRSTMTVKGKAQRLDVLFGPNYKAAVVWAPKPPAGQERNFICFEPMVGPTNAVNMAQKGTYTELQSIAPGATWKESFWVKASGFEPAPPPAVKCTPRRLVPASALQRRCWEEPGSASPRSGSRPAAAGTRCSWD